MNPTSMLALTLCGAALTSSFQSRADAVTEWSAHLEEAVFATAEPIPSQPRSAAIVHLAIFDAVNGIDRRYTPYHVTERAPSGARAEAAAIQAAYTTLLALYPAHASVLDTHLATAIANLPGGTGVSQSIARGRAWGDYVAARILELRSTDRWNEPQEPFMGGFATGQWRSLPTATDGDGALPAVFPQLAVLVPFAMSSPDQFRPGPPYGAPIPESLQTPEYAADLAEVKAIGRIDSPDRTEDETLGARLWQAMGPIDELRAARAVVSPTAKLVDNARPVRIGEHGRLRCPHHRLGLEV